MATNWNDFTPIDAPAASDDAVDWSSFTPVNEESSALRRVGDVGISALKGAISVPEAAVGLIDIPTGGRAGKVAESLGFRPKEAKAILDENLSPEQQAANRAVSEAEGFTGTVKAALQNPSVIGHTVVESLPSMGASGVVGRGLATGAKLAPWLAGAIGEGVIGAGSAAESIRQNTGDGLLTAGQSAAALASGAGTAAFGAAGGRVAQKLGIADVDTLLAGGASKVTSAGVIKRILSGGISEGMFEELPQSAQEQVWQNAALGKPLLEGVPEAAGLGFVTGAAMGGIASGAFPGRETREQEPPAPKVSDIANAGSVDEAIAAADSVISAPVERSSSFEAQNAVADLERQAGMASPTATDPEFESFLKEEQIDTAYLRQQAEEASQRAREFELAEQARREADIPKMVEQRQDQTVEIAQALTNAQGFDSAEPSAMQLAMERALAKANKKKGLIDMQPSAPAAKEQAKIEVPNMEFANDRNAAAVDLPVSNEFDGSAETRAPVLGDAQVGRAPDAQLPEAGPANPDPAAPAGTTDIPAPNYSADRQPALKETTPSTAPMAEVIEPAVAKVAMEVNLPNGTVAGGVTEIGALHDAVREKQIPANEKRAVRFGLVNEREAARIKEATGLDVSGYKHSIDSFAIRHAYQKHGNAKQEALRGQLAITREDILRIPEIVANPDEITPLGKDALKNDLIRYKKAFNGTTYYVEEVRTKRGELAAKTLWKTRTASNAAEAAPSRTSETLRPESPQGKESIAPNKNSSLQESQQAPTLEVPELDPDLDEYAAELEAWAAENKAGSLIDEAIGGNLITDEEINERFTETGDVRREAEEDPAGQAPGSAEDRTEAPEGQGKAAADEGLKESATDSTKFFKRGSGDAVADGVIPDDELPAPKPFRNKTDANLFKAKNRLTEVSLIETEAGWAFQPNPAPLTAEQKAQVRDDVAELNKALKSAGAGQVLPLFEPPTPQHALAQSIAKVFGTTVHFVSDNKVFDGVAYKGIAYLKKNMSRPELAIAGHEVFHTLEQSNPKLAEKLLSHVRTYLNEGAIPDRKTREELVGGKPVSERYAAGEVLADINGAMWLDPKFWREMIQRDVNLFRRVAYLFMEKATQAVESLVGTRFDVSALVTDVDAVRSLIAQTWADHLQGRDGKASNANSGISMSRERNFLKELSQYDDIFRLPKSEKATLEGIVTDNDPRIQVKKLGQVPGEVARYQFILPDDSTARMVVRRPSSVYGFETVDEGMRVTDERLPGENPDAAQGKEEVFIDVSLLDPAKGFGAAIYNIAANYAHNTGRIFIGDPAGLSDEAMFRRPQQMLSSALKFGTTEHLAPHPRQIKGDKELGIPPLKWTHGDDSGNIRNLIDVTLSSLENNGGNGNISYNVKNGRFEDADGNELSRDDIAGMAGVGLGREAQAGGATLARHALFRALVQEEGGRGRSADRESNGILESLVEQLRQFGSADSKSTLDRLFYSRAELTETPAFKRWFGDSKVVGEDGKPLVVYHGTIEDFDAFDPDTIGNTFRADDRGFFFISDPKQASSYATHDSVGMKAESGGNVIPAYVSLQNPLIVDDAFLRKEGMAPIGEAEDVISFWDNYQSLIHEWMDERRSDGVILVDNSYKIKGEPTKMVVALKPTQIKSATGNNGDFDATNPDIRFSRINQVAGTWMAPEPSKLFGLIDKDSLIHSLQDKQIDTKRVVQAIRDAVGAIDDKWNPYLQEELFHGRSAKGVKDFLGNELKPLLQDMQLRKVEMGELEEYLQMRHAEERNNQIAKVNPNMPDGGSGVDTADARAYLANLPADKKRAFDALAKKVDAINKATRKLLVDAGLETQETVDAWEAAYQFYVPLQREETGAGIGQGFSVRGSSSKRAMGSKKGVVDILANIAMQRERAIVRAEKNRVATALYGLAITQPNPEFWLPVNPENPGPNVQQELVGLGMNPVDAKNLIDEPMQRYIDPRTGLVAERVNPLLRTGRNVLSVRVNGKDRYVFFNEDNERAMRMVATLKNLDADQLGRVLSLSAKVTRHFASINTQYNPVFGAINLIRDVQGALLNLSTTPLAGKQKEVMAHTLSALRGIYIDLRDHRAGKVPSSNWAAEFEEFQNEGGQTGYRNMFSTSAERANALKRELNAISEGKLKAGARAVFDWLSDYNETMENAVRLAAYKTAKEQGMTKQQAASVAKNLTVNFNRKGAIATQAGAMYAFFNASVQGSTRLIQTLRGPAGKKIIMGGLLLGSVQALVLAAAGYDDGEPPDFVKDRNVVIPIGDGKYLTVPMPLGFNILPAISRITTEFVLGGFKNPTEHLAHLIDQFADIFNPIGNAGFSLQTITPTAIDPLAALTENRDWTGKPIAKKDFNSMAPTPGYTRAKDTASEISKTLSYWINLASGGTKYTPGLVSPTPDQLDYLIGQVTGGVGREALKIEQTVTSTLSGEELPPNKVPFFGRFYGDTKGQSGIASKFYDNLTELNKHEAEIKGRRKDKGDVMGYLRDNPDARLVNAANDAEKDVQKLKRKKRELLEKDASKERVKLVEQQITARMKRFNDRVEALRQRQAD